MNAATDEVQIIRDATGSPLYAVLPYPAYSQLEASEKLRPSSRRKIAEALGLAPEQIV